MTEYGVRLLDQHAAMLEASGIPPDFARERGYVSIDVKRRLEDLKVTKSGRNVPGLLLPLRSVDGSVWGYQYRPDEPRVTDAGRVVKYETPRGQRNGIDVPPGVGEKVSDPSVPLWITEGTKKADAAAVRGLACISLSGVWNWRGTNGAGGKAALADWHDVALNGRRVVLAFDSDATRKREVSRALRALADYLATKGANVVFCHLPDLGDGKTGLDDYLAAGHAVEDLQKLVQPAPPPIAETREPATIATERERELPTPITLDECHGVFRRWLGDSYDLDALDAVLCAIAAERLDGDPLWLLIISGPGNTKTETVQAAIGAGAIVTSTIASEAALLSGTAKKDRSADATGGLLRRMGERGALVIKDVTSILSMHREARAGVLAALREVYDGFWERNLGVDGGRSLTWRGRLAVIGAVTTAWDQAHSVIAAMGDRFLVVRTDSSSGRTQAGLQALRNVGREERMRRELAQAVGGVIAGMDRETRVELSDVHVNRLIEAANLTTLARTACEYDYRGDVIDAHAPEAPTRFAKQLLQIVRGGLSVGMARDRAMQLSIRCARDSMPPLRLAILEDLAAHPDSDTQSVRKRLDKPYPTVRRQLQALDMLGLLTCDEVPVDGWGANPMDNHKPGKSRWLYSLAPGIAPEILLPDLSSYVGSGVQEREIERPTETARGGSDVSGNGSERASGDALEGEL